MTKLFPNPFARHLVQASSVQVNRKQILLRTVVKASRQLQGVPDLANAMQFTSNFAQFAFVLSIVQSHVWRSVPKGFIAAPLKTYNLVARPFCRPRCAAPAALRLPLPRRSDLQLGEVVWRRPSPCVVWWWFSLPAAAMPGSSRALGAFHFKLCRGQGSFQKPLLLRTLLRRHEFGSWRGLAAMLLGLVREPCVDSVHQLSGRLCMWPCEKHSSEAGVALHRSFSINLRS